MSFTAAHEVSESGTGAVRSTEVAKERWELMSCSAIEWLTIGMHRFRDYGLLDYELVSKSRWLLGQFLAGNGTNALVDGWACLNVAIQKMESTPEDYKAWVKQTKIRQSRDSGQIRYDLLPYHGLRHIAITCDEGATKYGVHNWHHGFQVLSLCNHCDRHLAQWLDGNRNEDHLGHANWNYMTPVHMLRNRPDMCEMMLGPNYTLTDEIKKNHEELAKARGEQNGTMKQREPMDTGCTVTAAKREEVKPFDTDDFLHRVAVHEMKHRDTLPAYDDQKDLDFDSRVAEVTRNKAPLVFDLQASQERAEAEWRRFKTTSVFDEPSVGGASDKKV